MTFGESLWAAVRILAIFMGLFVGIAAFAGGLATAHPLMALGGAALSVVSLGLFMHMLANG